jgi:hypothetical protein
MLCDDVCGLSIFEAITGACVLRLVNESLEKMFSGSDSGHTIAQRLWARESWLEFLRKWNVRMADPPSKISTKKMLKYFRNFLSIYSRENLISIQQTWTSRQGLLTIGVYKKFLPSSNAERFVIASQSLKSHSWATKRSESMELVGFAMWSSMERETNVIHLWLKGPCKRPKVWCISTSVSGPGKSLENFSNETMQDPGQCNFGRGTWDCT